MSDPSSAKSARPFAGGPEAMREMTEQGSAYAKDMYAKAQAAAEQVNRMFEQGFGGAAKNAADFNRQWLEMMRANTNAAFDFAGALAGAKSPAEFFELSAAHARKQVEAFSEQSQKLAALAQKVTSEAAQPLQAAAKSAFDKGA
jgi:phasin